MTTAVDVEYYIKNNYPWAKLPSSTKQGLGNSQKEYDKAVFVFSVKNQLRYKGNLVKLIKRDERRYYEDLLQYSREHLMLYPYHLADVIIKGLRVTPFNYYIGIMTDIMGHDKSYDCLPNFTAADCLRLLGIGRNQYIDLMNQCRSTKKFFRKKPVRDLLPVQPVEVTVMDPWWLAQTGFISEEDIRTCSPNEKKTVDMIIDSGPLPVGDLDINVLHGLYRKGLLYLDVPIEDEDCIVVPPLEGFVMNRVTGDYFETLLYNIFVSIDEHTPAVEVIHIDLHVHRRAFFNNIIVYEGCNCRKVASVLQIDLQLVKNAVSVYCRLGFAKKKTLETVHEHDLHLSWKNLPSVSKSKSCEDQLLMDWKDTILQTQMPDYTNTASIETSSTDNLSGLCLVTADNSQSAQIITPISGHKRIAFLFDSTLTAFLMMGNLSPGLKSHAVTMFEVGKLSDESMDSFLCELEKVGCEAEGEARRYFDHAITLRDTIKFLRYNHSLYPDAESDGPGPGIDLIRCESLLGLDIATRARILNKNYQLLVSMAPLSNEIRSVSSCIPQHFGPAIPEVSSVWFKLFLYHHTGCGPPSVLLVKGAKLRRLPAVLQDYERLLVTTWGHDPGVIAASNILITLNDVLTHSAVLVQAHGWQTEGQVAYVPFPIRDDPERPCESTSHQNHPCIKQLSSRLRLEHSAGFITLLNLGRDKTMTVYDNDSDISVIKSNTTSSSASIEVLNEPQNGIKDVNSAQILASELDQLQDSRRLSLDFKDPVPDSEMLPDKDWVLLDCSFGVPLFNSELNQAICSRILSCDLCSSQSLQKQLDSSRCITLQLLDFISQFQDVSSVVTQSNKFGEDFIPYPTQSLLFSDGSLKRWDGL